MKEGTRKKRYEDKLAAYLLQAGIIDNKEEVPVVEDSTPDMEAASLLHLVKYPKQFTIKTCTNCGETFATNYYYVGCCSNRCNALELAKIGIKWDSRKRPEDRWGGTPPAIVPQAALQALRELLSVQVEHTDAQEAQPENTDLSIFDEEFEVDPIFQNL